MATEHATESRRGPVADAIGAALDAHVASHLHRQVLRLAHGIAAIEVIPEAPTEASAFVMGPLREALLQFVGPAAVEAVLEELAPVVDSPRPSVGTPLKSDIRQAARPRAEALVLMASADRTGPESVARRLQERAIVRVVGDQVALVAAIQAYPGCRPLVVVDCCLPGIDPVLLASMLPSLPADTRVVLWGAMEQLQQQLYVTSPRTVDWVHCPLDATHDDLAVLVESLVEDIW